MSKLVVTDLAGIIARDRQFQPKGNSGASWTVAPTDTKLRLLEDRRALLGLLRETREAGYAALTDFIYAHGSDFDPAEWPGMAALRAALGEP